MESISIITALILGLLSLIHIYWAFGGSAGAEKAIPSIGGVPVFSPRAFMTILVALALAAFGIIALALGFNQKIHIPFIQYIVYPGWILAGVFLLRAIGDFKLVGFFKKIKDSEFARYDSLFYSPLCLALSGVFLLLTYYHH